MTARIVQKVVVPCLVLAAFFLSLQFLILPKDPKYIARESKVSRVDIADMNSLMSQLVEMMTQLRRSGDIYRIGQENDQMNLTQVAGGPLTDKVEASYKRVGEGFNNHGAGFNSRLRLKLWIDVPNDFPWRKCILDYNGVAASTDCLLTQHPASTWLVSIWTPSFRIINTENNRCLEPQSSVLTGSNQGTAVLVKDCSTGSGDWRYHETGQLEWSGGGCLSCLGASKGNRVALKPCNSTYLEQRFEFGVLTPDPASNSSKIWPLDLKDWEDRQRRSREDELLLSSPPVLDTLKQRFEYTGMEPRRAVVFYNDKGSGAIAYLKWWILAWKLLGLNSATERFDIVIFSHPESIQFIPTECQRYWVGKTELKGAGKCLYVPLVGISHRDNSYDVYINSHECLVNEESSFLSQYSHILRSDMDTFPGPGLLGSWPTAVLANKFRGYTFKNASGVSQITEALKEVAASLGLQHKGWHDIGSSWFGPSEKVLKLSKLTVSLSRYIRSYMFGPGTHCRCANCSSLPQDCQWGSGPYAGTLLLYAQEIAMNLVWTQAEYESLTKGYLDMGTTSEESVCEILHLHVFHNAEPFSKFSFVMGKYKDYNMSRLDVRTTRGYAVYLALQSAGQGKEGEKVTARFRLGQDGSLAKICNSTKVEKKT